MKINKYTRISELILVNKQSIDAIAALSKTLEKLKNPVLRKVMASRVTIEEAAKMGKCTEEDFARVLLPLGFEFENNKESRRPAVPAAALPEWLQNLPAEKITKFDVRPVLASGSDPLKEIMQRFKQVETGKALCIINTFVPTPLVKLFEKDNALSYTKTINPNEFHTYFLKQGKKKILKERVQSSSNIFTEDEATFQQSKEKYTAADLIEIDVRHLEMPGPMQAILAALDKLPDGKALYVYHKRVPVYLLEELESKSFIIHILSVSETEVKLLIEKS